MNKELLVQKFGIILLITIERPSAFCRYFLSLKAPEKKTTKHKITLLF